jgi:beta-lactamase class A
MRPSRRAAGLLPALACVAALACERPPSTAELELVIRGRLGLTPGTYGIAFLDLGTGAELYMGADSVFHAASLMKVPVMIEVFRRAEAGHFQLDDSITVTDTFRSIVDGSPYVLPLDSDSDSTLYEQIGRRVPIRSVVERMIVRSGNLAANLLVDLVSADSIQATIERMGATTMRVRRGVEDLKAYERGLNNTATARDMARLLMALARGEAVSRDASAAMLEILMRDEFRDRIPAGVPAGTRVANKVGFITAVDHDAAIVFPKQSKPYVLVVLTSGIEDAARSRRAIADISRLVWIWVTQPGQVPRQD